MYMRKTIDKAKIDKIVSTQLYDIPQVIKDHNPTFLYDKNTKYFHILADEYFFLAFLSEKEMSRANKLMSSGIHPFPGLFTCIDTNLPTAFKFGNARYVLLDGNTVKNALLLSLGKDSTIIIRNHHQAINISGVGNFDYIVELAYIVTFGISINQSNVLDYLEDLIAYSINHWGNKVI